jgi:hypothetical protein
MIVRYTSAVPVPDGEEVGLGVGYAGDEGWKLAAVTEMVVPLGIVPPLGNVIEPVIPATAGNGSAVPVVSGTVVAADVGPGVGVAVPVAPGVGVGVGVAPAAALGVGVGLNGAVELELPPQPAITVALATTASPKSRNGTTKPGRFMRPLPRFVTG